MTTPFSRSRIAAAVGMVALALGAGQVSAAGFALQENSGSGLGNAYAGGAASAEDAATLWSNVAGISKIKTNQVVGAINLIQPSFKFSNGASLPAAQQPLGGDGGNAGSLNVVPNLYLVVPINKEWTFGLGVNAPFGLVDEYDNGWIGRYQALKSDIKTMNINPAVSWQVTDNVAIGAGANYQQIKATLTSNVNYSGALAQALGQAIAGGKIPPSVAQPFLASTMGLDADANINGDDSAWGWNAGILVDLDKNNRFGLAWRSGIKYNNISGNVSVTPPPAPTLPSPIAPVYALLSTAVNAQLPSGGVKAEIELPGIANFSWFGHVADRWDVMADVQWTQWSKIQNLTFVSNTGAVVGNTPENFQDAWRYSLGATYHYGDSWLFRGGVAYDQSPVQDAFRNPRLPDNDRTWLTAGAQYRMKDPDLRFDMGLAYIWVKDASINDNAGSTPSYGLINGTYNNSVIVVSGQVTYSF